MKKKIFFLFLLTIIASTVGCTTVDNTVSEDLVVPTETTSPVAPEGASSTEAEPESPSQDVVAVDSPPSAHSTSAEESSDKSDSFIGYTLIELDGGSLSGHREPNAVVDIGYGDRKYWAFTNEHGQLVRVLADVITLQDDKNEPVLSNGRYYRDEAKVPGVESPDLDEGHVIADSLGGVSNAYNITPQNSTLNRHGDQAYLEKVIRDAGGATNFEAIITYPNTNTQIPSHYQFTYTVKGNKVVDSFDNIDPDEANAKAGLTTEQPSGENTTHTKNDSDSNKLEATQNLSNIDKDGNGTVTIKEAKDAGFKMPITREHWLYQYMRDNDNDGMVGE